MAIRACFPKAYGTVILAISLCFLSFQDCRADDIGRDSLKVYVFLSETCPICRNQTHSLRELYLEFRQQGVGFVAVFPNLENSTPETIMKFGKKYQLKFPLVRDENHFLTEKFQAKVTPQVFVVEQNSEKVRYSGKVDNSFESIGKRRSVTTEFYLRDALNALIHNKNVILSETQPVGCYIVK